MYAYTRLPRHWLLHLHASNCHVTRDFYYSDIFNRVRVHCCELRIVHCCET